MSKFLKKGDVQLINGGYLSNKKGDPITNSEFVQLQQEAHYLATLASKMKGKDFEGKQADDINELIAETKAELSKEKVEEFLKAPKTPKSSITDGLKKEALEFVEFHVKSAEVSRINEKLQPFKTINEFETFGLFFSSGVVKLDKIYTMDEIKEAAQIVYSVL